MTEAEWLTAETPGPMLEFLRGDPTPEAAVTWYKPGWELEAAGRGINRKFRLFGCACCRRIWSHIPEQCNRDAVVAVEDYLEGRLSASALQEAFTASYRVEQNEHGARMEPGYWAVKNLGRGFYKMTAAQSAQTIAWRVISMAKAEQVPLAALVRCIFGNPFRLVIFNRAWRSSTATSLAQAIYDERAFDRLPILADA